MRPQSHPATGALSDKSTKLSNARTEAGKPNRVQAKRGSQKNQTETKAERAESQTEIQSAQATPALMMFDPS